VKVLGLTGSICMGKSATAAMFAAEGVPVYDADAEIHRMYAPGGAAVKAVGEAFPDAIQSGGVDRAALSRSVVANPAQLKKLEAIIHPMVASSRARFLEAARRRGEPLAVVDIPLLFEVGAENTVDAVVVVSAPETVQRARVLARPGMTVEKFESLLARQTPDAEKRARADYILDTAESLDATRDQVRQLIAELKRG
jgi:dephospho-CoA kinase